MSDDEQRYVLGLAYQVGPDDKIQKGADGKRDFFSAEELEKCAWNFLKSGPQSGMFHADGTEGAAEVVESYIYRGPDWTVGQDGDGKDVIVKSGDWLVGAVLSEQAWELKKQGAIKGWSPQGRVQRRPKE